MSVQITIANHAARLLKVRRITSASLTQPDTEFARAVKDVSDAVRRRLLRRHNWNFAIERFSTSPDATAPKYGFLYSYTLPPLTLRLIELDEGGNYKYKREGNLRVKTDIPTSLKGRVVVDITDESYYDAHFASLYAYDLALEVAEAVGASSTLKAELKSRRKEIMDEAVQDDAFEDSEDNYLDEQDQDIMASRS